MHYEAGFTKDILQSELPLTLPDLKEFAPSGTGESPLANAKEWLEYKHERFGKGRKQRDDKCNICDLYG